MVLRCSLLGHDYGEAQVERKREERGSEVVVTVEEFRACTRCDERTVLSENTEVTTLVDADAADGAIESSATAADPGGLGADGQPDHAGDDGFETGQTDADPAHRTGHDDGSRAERFAEEGIPTTPEGDPIIDDGEILEDEPEDGVDDREYGQWPDSDDVGPPVADDEPAAWPDADSAIEENEGNPGSADTGSGDGTSAGHEYTFAETTEPGADEPIEDDAIVLDDTPSTGDMRGANEVATETDLTEPDDQEVTDTGFESPDGELSPGESPSREGVPTEFYCPRCQFVAPGTRGSLRSGDICPECQQGYLGEREQ